MKKFTEKDFKNFILKEAKKVSEKDGLSLILKESIEPTKEVIEESVDTLEECPCDEKKEDFLTSDNFEEVQPEEFMEEATEVKYLSEEISRMKQLLNFNNPLLKL